MQIPVVYYANYYDSVTDTIRGCIIWSRNREIACGGAKKKLGAVEPLTEENWLFIRGNKFHQEEAERFSFPTYFI